jgi:FeS assembly SUF system protein
VGLFSFFTGKKEKHEVHEEVSKAPASEGHEGAVAETGVVEPRSAEISAPPGPPDMPGDIPFDSAQGTPSAERRAPSAETPFHAPDAWNVDALTAPKPEVAGEKVQVGPVDAGKTAEFQPKVVEALKTVFDPEIPVDIYELGLVYGIEVDAEQNVLVNMTLTSPACPSAQQIPSEARYKVKAIPGVKDAWVEIVWEPPWDKDRMSEAAKLQLGFF